MTDTVSQLRDAQAKASAKVKRLRGQLESAELELSELDTALRVLERLSGEKPSGSAAAQNDNGQQIWRLVGVGRSEAKAPKDIIEALRNEGLDLGPDLVRTQLWRMAKRGELKSDSGVYWRPVITASEEDEDDGTMEPNPPLTVTRGWEGVGRSNPFAEPDDDLSDDIPF